MGILRTGNARGERIAEKGPYRKKKWGEQMPGWLMNKVRETFFKKLQKFCSNKNKTVETEPPTESPKGLREHRNRPKGPKFRRLK